MALKLVNIGTSVNSKDGDVLRTAFDKINQNFTELYNTAAADATDRLVKDDKELILNVDGDRAWVDFPAAFGESITVQGSEIGSIASPIVLSGTDSVMLSAIGESRLNWNFDSTGSLTFPDDLTISNSVISRRLEQGADAIGAKLTLTDNNISMEAYADPEGLNNIQYARISAGLSGAVLKFGVEDVAGETYGQLTVGAGLTFTFSDGVLTTNFNIDPAGIVTLSNSSYLEPTGIDLNVGAQGVVTIRSDAASNLTTKEWVFDEMGTLTVPHMFPRTFTATVDSAHYYGEGSLTLEGDAWHFDVTFNANSAGYIENIITNETPWASNPGYVNDIVFRFTEEDHGVPGYTFDLTLTDIQNPGPMMYTTNLAASQPPVYPATIKNGESIKLTADATSWTFGANGTLLLPDGANIAHGDVRLSLNLDEGNAAYLTTTTDDTTALYLTTTGAQLYASETASLSAGAGVEIIYNNYFAQETLFQITEAEWESSIAPAQSPWAGLNSYDAYPVIMQNMPWTGGGLPPPSNIVPIAKTASDAYDLWQEALANTNVSIGVAGNDWEFGSTGGLTFPDTTVQTTAFTGTGDIRFDGNKLFNTTGNSVVLAAAQYSGETFIVLPSNDDAATQPLTLRNMIGDVLIGTNSAGNWRFNAVDQSLSIPYGWGEGFSGAAKLAAPNGDITLTSSNDASTSSWVFGANGALGQNGCYTRTTTPFVTDISPSGVIWTSLHDFISSVKLTIQLECTQVGDVTGWHSQICEAVIASRGAGQYGEPIMTVYGVTYTSSVPLATFTVQRNLVNNKIEVVATRTAATSDGLDFRIHSVEMATRD